MMNNYEPPDDRLTIEDAARNLVNAIADMVHATINAKMAATTTTKATAVPDDDDANDESDDEEIHVGDITSGDIHIREVEPESPEDIAAREAREKAEAEAREAVDRRVPNGTTIRLTGLGRIDSGLEAELRGGRLTFPDSLRTAIATIFREEPSIVSLSNVRMNNDANVSYAARRVTYPDTRSIILTCDMFPEEIRISVDDLAEAEIPM